MTSHVYHVSLGMLSFLVAGALQPTVPTEVIQLGFVPIRHSFVVLSIGIFLAALLLGKGRNSARLVFHGILATLPLVAVGLLIVVPLVGLTPHRFLWRLILYTMVYGSAFGWLAYGRSQFVRFALIGLGFGVGMSLIFHASLAYDPNAPLRGILQLNSFQIETLITYMACGGTVGLGMSCNQVVVTEEEVPIRRTMRDPTQPI